MSISGIYALTNQVSETVIKSGIVDIKLQVYKQDGNNNEMLYGEQEKKVMPGEIVSFIPKTHNFGASCYLRVKVNYMNDNTDFLDYVTGFSEHFNKYGEYYYYDKTLAQNETVKLFDTIRIPEDLTSITPDGKIKIEIIAQAIQDKNFQPDYNSADPWKGVKPEKTINDSYDISDGTHKVTICYENNTDKYIDIPNSFIGNFNNLVPGDSYSDSISINNTKKSTAKYFLRFNTNQNSYNDILLLDNINLKIINSKGNVIYSGSLNCKDKITLGEYKPNDKDSLKFIIEVPANLNNKFENLNPNLELIFSAEYDGKNDDSGTDKGPQTGDSINVTIIVFFISTIGLIVVMILNYIVQRKNDTM